MFWRKTKYHNGELIDDKCKLGVEITRLDRIEERLKQLECEHGPYVFGVQFFSYAKQCTKCGKIWKFDNNCEWLKQKHEQEKAIADATAKKLKECKP
jgi:hypothetical protein